MKKTFFPVLLILCLFSTVTSSLAAAPTQEITLIVNASACLRLQRVGYHHQAASTCARLESR
ncbi:MAG: hypothetical protein Q7J84_15200 [Sulfuricaulis sp.]|nr:hypothetical protein [Sulfuricaulis sp.]